MPPSPRKKAAAKAAPKPAVDGMYRWDALVAESRVDKPPYELVVPVEEPTEEEPDAVELLVIPCPNGRAYINLSNAQRRGDVAGILIALTESGDDEKANSELFRRIYALVGGADFPIVEKLGLSVVGHYFNRAPSAEDGSEGGPGE